MPQQYLWGKSGKVWHALARHDPKFFFEEVVSESLTAKRRQKTRDSKAPDVVMLIPHRTKKPGPGTGSSLCGLTNLSLSKLGVDPVKRDALCPSCKAHAASG